MIEDCQTVFFGGKTPQGPQPCPAGAVSFDDVVFANNALIRIPPNTAMLSGGHQWPGRAPALLGAQDAFLKNEPLPSVLESKDHREHKLSSSTPDGFQRQ
jgi:hypothetical protein